MKNAPAGGPGQGDEADKADFSPTASVSNRQADPRLAFLLRAAAKLDLVEAGYQDLDSAIADLVVVFRALCQRERAILASIERHHLRQRQQWLRAWRWRSS
jgi:hypothetical protein